VSRTARTGAPKAVLSWLQSLLKEWLHAQLQLRQPQPDFYEISVPGSSGRVVMPCWFALFDRNGNDLPCGRWTPAVDTWLPPGVRDLPTPGLEDPADSMVQFNGDHGFIHYDVLSLSYWMLSRREEVGSSHRDDCDRFPAEASHAYRHGYLERPIVDEWWIVLRRTVQAIWPTLPLQDTRYQITLSHDVDAPGRYSLMPPNRLVRNMVADLFKYRHRCRRILMQAPRIWRASKHRLDHRDPFNTFDWIMDQSEQLGLRNAFYFICGHTEPKRDGTYFPTEAAVLDLMKRIHKRGHEVGLHPSYHTYLRPDELRNEADRLREARRKAGLPDDAIGARMHFLRWRTPDTLHALDAAGIVYDTTLGYAKHPGFRCGTCREYQAFDPAKRTSMNVRLRPLIVMESTVIREMQPSDEDALAERLSQLMRACHRVQGNFTLLWHNTMLERTYQRRLYQRVLDEHKELAT